MITTQKTTAQGHPTHTSAHKFDIFKGTVNSDGKIVKIRSVGTASILPGSRTYHLQLRTFLNNEYFLLPEGKENATFDYAILTREPSVKPGRKYYWHNVGEARILAGENSCLMELDWDLFGHGNIFMSLYPFAVPTAEQEPLKPHDICFKSEDSEFSNAAV